ncbi:MAG: hypothetical protein WBB73_04075 [Candidatus Aminicenantaceae bacterium]
MKELETDNLSNAEFEREIINNSEDLLEYCDVCFIALGSQEKRIYKRQKAFHLDCEARAKF